MLFAFFVFGTMWFWALIILFIMFEMAFVVNERSTESFILFIAFVLLLVLFGDFQPWIYLKANPIMALVFAGGYVVSGCLTAFLKWIMFNKRIIKKYNNLRDKFMIANGLAAHSHIPESLKDSWKSKLHASWDNTELKNAIFPLLIKDYKSNFVYWASYWPFVLFWTVFEQLFIKLWENLMLFCSGMFNKASAWIWRGVKSDFK